MLSTQDPNNQPGKTFFLWRPIVTFWHWMFPPTVAHRDRQSTKARIVAGTVIITVLLGLIALSLIYGKTVYKFYKTLRSNYLVDSSEKLEAESRILEAHTQANLAYNFDPDNPKAVRHLAKIATIGGAPEARYLWNKLRQLGALTDDDVIMEIRALSGQRQNETAAEQIEQILRQTKPTRAIVEEADRVMHSLNRRGKLLEILKSYLEQHPEDHEIQLLLATRQIQFNLGVDKFEGLVTLWELAQLNDKIGLEAIDFLTALKLENKEDKERLIDLLQKHPLAKEEHRIAALQQLASLEPGRKMEIVDQAIKERINAKREDKVPLSRWLVLEAVKEPIYAEKLLTFIREEAAIEYEPLLGNYLNALTILKQYDSLARVINDPRTRLTTADRSYHKVHLAYVTNKDWEEVNSLMVDALAAARGAAKPKLILQLANYAEERGHLLVAEQAYEAGTTMPMIEKIAYEGMLRLSYRNGNSKGFVAAATEVSRRWPDNSGYLEQAMYASLLAGIEMETSFAKATSMLEDRPKDTQRKLIMALALMRQLDPKAAAKHLDRVNLSELKPGQAAVMCGIMQSAGYMRQAGDIAQQIPKGTIMLPEEERFLQPVVGSDTSSQSPSPIQKMDRAGLNPADSPIPLQSVITPAP